MRCALLPVSLCAAHSIAAAHVRCTLAPAPHSTLSPFSIRCCCHRWTAVASPPAVRSPSQPAVRSHGQPDAPRAHRSAGHCQEQARHCSARSGGAPAAQGKTKLGRIWALTHASHCSDSVVLRLPGLFAFARWWASSSTAMTKRRNMHPSQWPRRSANIPDRGLRQTHPICMLTDASLSPLLPPCVLLPVPA
jgi:hypothetical protein